MFRNREEVGQLLAGELSEYKERPDLVVLGLPRGGVVVAKVIAQKLKAPLDIVVVRKIGAPNEPELAVGAVGPEGVRIINWRVVRSSGADKNYLKAKTRELKEEIRGRELKFRGKRQAANLKDKIVILVDDGVATGATSLAAAKFIKKMGAKKTILATPVIASDTFLNIKKYFDEVIFLEKPSEFWAVGQFYEEFPQVEDEEVKKLL